MNFSKALAVVFGCFFATASFASSVSVAPAAEFLPKRGDYTIYEVTVGNFKSTQMTRIDQASDGRREPFYTIGNYSEERDGQFRLLENRGASDYELRQQYISDISSFCKDARGTLENITLASINFLACKVTDTIHGEYVSVAWIAAFVPFGIIKQTITNYYDPRDFHGMELLSYGTQN